VSAAMQVFLGVWKKAKLERSLYENRTWCTGWRVDLGLGIFPTASIAGIEQQRHLHTARTSLTLSLTTQSNISAASSYGGLPAEERAGSCGRTERYFFLEGMMKTSWAGQSGPRH
jgi:hypothetical protein